MRSERGYVGRGLLVGLGLISLLVWIVPMVFLSRKQAEVLTVAAAPAGAHGASGEGQAPADPIGRASDVQAQSMLSTAINAAQAWYAETGTFAGFGPEQAAAFDATTPFTSGSPAPGSVSIRVTPDSVVMVTLTSRGDPLCAATASGIVSEGRANASTPQQCSGGW